MLEKVLQHDMTFGSEYTFGVKLYAMNVVLTMAQSHNLPLIADGCHFKTVGKILLADHP